MAKRRRNRFSRRSGEAAIFRLHYFLAVLLGVTATAQAQSSIVIIESPASISVTERDPATFNVVAFGTPRDYFWFSNNVQVAGNNQASFIIPSAAYPANDGAQIYVVVSNAVSLVTSATAALTVTPDTTTLSVISAVGQVDPTKVVVRFSEPVNPAVDPSSFTIFPTGGDPDGAEARHTLDVVFANSNATVILTTEARAARSNYSLRVSSVVDASSQQNALSPNPTIVPLRSIIQLVGFDTDNEWKYDLNNGDRLGTGWELPGYDDSAWPSGQALLGLELNHSVNGVPLRTMLPYAFDSATAYFRKHFTLPGPTNGVVLTLRDCVDDGAVYYLNGQEVFRNRMPTGQVTFATRAITAPDPTPIAGPFILSISNLLVGDNVLAVEVHQTGSTSSDLDMAAELLASNLSSLTGPPLITGQPKNQILTPQSPAKLEVAAGGKLPLTYQWRRNGTVLSTATNSTYSIANAVLSDAGDYAVAVSNSEGSVTSAVATLSVLIDLTLRISRDPVTGQVSITRTGGTLQQAAHLLNGGLTDWTDVPGNPNPYLITPASSTNHFFRVPP